MINTNALTTQDQDLKFFKEIKNELSFMSTRKMIYLVRSVLSHVRRSLSYSQISEVINKMPSLFQLVFISNWRYEDQKQDIVHLDELVESIYEEDRKNNKPLFKSEIEVLSGVIVVLNSLNKFFDLFGITTFPYPLLQELQQAVQEDAA